MLSGVKAILRNIEEVETDEEAIRLFHMATDGADLYFSREQVNPPFPLLNQIIGIGLESKHSFSLTLRICLSTSHDMNPGQAQELYTHMCPLCGTFATLTRLLPLMATPDSRVHLIQANLSAKQQVYIAPV